VNIVKNIIVDFGGAFSFIPILGSADWGYNFMLDQFGISRSAYSGGADNGFQNYLNAVLNPSLVLWQPGFVDLASYDMGPEACYFFNAKTSYTYPATYYFAHTTTRTDTCGAIQCADPAMNLIMAPTADIIGSISTSSLSCATFINCTSANVWCQHGAGSTTTPFCYDATWQENDGLVPFRSSIAPIIGTNPSQYSAPLLRDNYVNAWAHNAWYYHNHTTWANGPRDHMQIIGFDFNLLEDPSDSAYSLVLQEIQYAWAN